MVFAHRHNHPGLESASGIILTMVLRSICSGMVGLPQSLPCEKLQSVVAIIPTAPAALARSARSAMTSRPPSQ
nr:hypothetical protein CPGR_02416 [Mycolicibacter nonchromogenicus]